MFGGYSILSIPCKFAKFLRVMKRTPSVLGLGVFDISTMEFGVIGMLPQVAAAFDISIVIFDSWHNKIWLLLITSVKIVIL